MKGSFIIVTSLLVIFAIDEIASDEPSPIPPNRLHENHQLPIQLHLFKRALDYNSSPSSPQKNNPRGLNGDSSPASMDSPKARAKRSSLPSFMKGDEHFTGEILPTDESADCGESDNLNVLQYVVTVVHEGVNLLKDLLKHQDANHWKGDVEEGLGYRAEEEEEEECAEEDECDEQPLLLEEDIP